VILVVMGVSGCGKTAVGRAIAEALGWPFLDGDDFHPPANVEKMRAGTPLTDDDRWPWLDRLVDEARNAAGREGHAVLGCSALRQAYRDRLARAGDVRFVHLHGDRATIAARIAGRQHRYMPATLLDSQFATLEPPADALVVDVALPIDEQVAQVLDAFGLRRAPK
jgi:carbohydrate kinase (thermoresistant glucokinase family)